MRVAVAVLGALLALASCAGYRPGVDGRVPTLSQNLKSNGEPESAGSMPR